MPDRRFGITLGQKAVAGAESPGRATGCPLKPKIFFIIFKSLFIQKAPQFILVSETAVVLPLIPDVVFHLPYLGLSNR